MTDLDVKSEVTRDAEWVDELWLVGDDVGDVIEDSEVGEEMGVEELGVVLDDAAADGGVLEGALVDEAAADDGVGVGVVTAAPVLAGVDDPVPPINPVTPPVTCEMSEETSSVKSFFWCCLANTFESSQLAWATATTAKTTRVCRYSILMVLMEKLMERKIGIAVVCWCCPCLVFNEMTRDCLSAAGWCCAVADGVVGESETSVRRKEDDKSNAQGEWKM